MRVLKHPAVIIALVGSISFVIAVVAFGIVLANDEGRCRDDGSCGGLTLVSQGGLIITVMCAFALAVMGIARFIERRS